MLKYFFVAMAFFMPLAVYAEPKQYTCKFQRQPSTRIEPESSLVPKEAVFEIDEENGTATAYDAFIHYVHQAPKHVKFTKNRKGMFRLSWKLAGIPVQTTWSSDGITQLSSKSKRSFRYLFVLDPQKLQGELSATGAGKRHLDPGIMVCKVTS